MALVAPGFPTVNVPARLAATCPHCVRLPLGWGANRPAACAAGPAVSIDQNVGAGTERRPSTRDHPFESLDGGRWQACCRRVHDRARCPPARIGADCGSSLEVGHVFHGPIPRYRSVGRTLLAEDETHRSRSHRPPSSSCGRCRGGLIKTRLRHVATTHSGSPPPRAPPHAEDADTPTKERR
jgi:hypothetical protein